MYLLDTHAFIWLLSASKLLPPQLRQRLLNDPPELYFSSISGLEIALLIKRQRLSLPLSAADFITKGLSHHHIHEIKVDWKIAVAASNLPDIHDDPFDRILIATANLNGLTMITKDEIIPRYPVKTIWA